MKNKERRAKLDKLEKAIDKELAYDYDLSLPDKYNLNSRLISGDEYAKKMVLDTYNNINTLYGLFDPLTIRRSIQIFSIIIVVLMNLASLAMLIALLIKRSDSSAIAVLIELGFILLGYIELKSTKNKKMYVYMYKEDGKNIIIYKDIKKEIYTVYMNKNQIYRYEDEEWNQVKRKYHVWGRLLFQHLCGELMVKEHKDGIIEIYCRNRAAFELKSQMPYAKSANFLIKDGKPWIINYYTSNLEFELVRSSNSEQLEILEINTDRVAEVPKSFLKFCKKEGIEPLKENEHLRYV